MPPALLQKEMQNTERTSRKSLVAFQFLKIKTCFLVVVWFFKFA